MDGARLQFVDDIEGYSPHFGRLVSMMNFARHTTLQTVEGLSIGDLDHLHDESSNTIGALLLHIAAVDRVYQIFTLEERTLTKEDLADWGAALTLGDAARKTITGKPLEHYTERLASVRETTLDEFRTRNDDWLLAERPWGENGPSNHHFLWFHVFEDEINHRGQIRWLVSRLPGRDAQ